MLPRTYRLSIFIVFFATLQLSIFTAAEIIAEQPNLTSHDHKDTLDLPQNQIMGLGLMKGTKLSNKVDTTVIRPPQVLLDVERYPVAPPGLQLQQVHIYIRHGKF